MSHPSSYALTKAIGRFPEYPEGYPADPQNPSAARPLGRSVTRGDRSATAPIAPADASHAAD